NNTFFNYTFHPTNPDGSFYYVARDTDSNGSQGPPTGYSVIRLIPVSVAAFINLQVRIALADGDEDYESSDYVEVYVATNGLPVTNLIGAVRGTSPNTDALHLDADLNGTGDPAGQSTITDFTDFTFNVSGSPNTMILAIRVRMSANSEMAALDNIRILGDPRPSPVINSPATAISGSTADLNVLFDGTNEVFHVSVYWGLTNGGAISTNWANSALVGTFTNQLPTNLTHGVTGLIPNTNYWFTWRATNSSLDTWANPSLSFFTEDRDIVGTVIEDSNGNGLLDVEETNGWGIAGVTLTLLDTNGMPVDVAITDSNGVFVFSDVPIGDYTVVETDPPGFISTGDLIPPNDNQIPVTHVAGVDITGLYFLDAMPTDIQGRVLDDLDADGDLSDPDPGIPGVTVVLQTTNGVGVATNLTDATGTYLFTNIPPGLYQVVEIDLPGYISSNDREPPNDNRISFLAASGASVDGLDFLDYRNANIGDRVWNDLNLNGIQNPGETGLVNVTVRLYDAATNFISTTNTDASGMYQFTNLTPGIYVLEFPTLPGFDLSPMDQGGDDGLDSDPDPGNGFTPPALLVSGQTITNLDAGQFIAAEIGDRVWNDIDGDGLQDPGEPGLPG
ncbi:MAG: SdrD B-like domain-containing protein, partial [Verrucomicrobiota bacterium]